jgi:hypothetical protein
VLREESVRAHDGSALALRVSSALGERGGRGKIRQSHRYVLPSLLHFVLGELRAVKLIIVFAKKRTLFVRRKSVFWCSRFPPEQKKGKSSRQN